MALPWSDLRSNDLAMAVVVLATVNAFGVALGRGVIIPLVNVASICLALSLVASCAAASIQSWLLVGFQVVVLLVCIPSHSAGGLSGVHILLFPCIPGALLCLGFEVHC